MNTRKMSKSGLDYLTELEGGMLLEVYLDSAGYPTVGVGHLITDDDELEVGDSITQERGLEFLSDDVREAEEAVTRYVNVTLSQQQFDALCCFIFNVGVGAFRRSTLLRKLNACDYDAVPNEMMRWVYAGGEPQEGLRKRRRETGELWSTGDYERDWHD